MATKLTPPHLDHSFEPSPDPSLVHLQLELARIDILIRREVRRWQLANQSPTDSFRGFYVSHEDADALLNRALWTSWGQTATLPPAEAEQFNLALAEAAGQAGAWVETAQQQGRRLRLVHLVDAFGLTRFELDALLICLAPALDLRYEQLYGYLQDHVARKRPGVNLILNLLADPGPQRLPLLSHFSAEAPLIKHRLLKLVAEPGQLEPPWLSQSLAVDPTLVAWLGGDYRPQPDFGLFAALIPAQADAIVPLLTEETRQALADLSLKPIWVFYGPDRGAQEAAAHLVAAQAQRPLLRVDLAGLIADKFTPAQALNLALRDARLMGAIPALFGWDSCRDPDSYKPPAHLLAEVCAYPDLIILAGQRAWPDDGGPRARPLFWREFPFPTHSQRQELWCYFLPSTAADGLDSAPLADQFVLTTDQIQAAVTSACDAASQRRSPLALADLAAAARAQSGRRLGALAQKIIPRFVWTDLILPDDQITLLREIVQMIQGRATVLESWQVGRKLAASQGVTMLFAGPPGTGKTMAAEVIAGEVGLDLYKIDLSSLVSKYIGETEKNLERIFSEAEHSNAILFFDEADALFGKRSEVRDSHDRYANIEISYLLQRMEAYDGVTILATNLRANLDEAFTRRLHFAVNFPFPDEADRRRIWQALFPATLPRHPEVDLEALASNFKLAGGNIRNIIVNAAYLAAADGNQVTMAHLRHSARRELQKMGKIVKESEGEPKHG
ncbi:MAG: ATP-binding protein [Anaerolineae bacterium]|nr:ATP-binding protein [Anaerolineae bacterium]